MDDTRLNPLKAARQARGLKRSTLAMKLAASYDRVTAVELGHVAAIPERWRPRLEQAGFDFDRLARDYKSWRISRSSEDVEG